MQRAQHEVTGERRLHSHPRRVLVTNLADHDDVWVLSQHAAQCAREGEADLRVDLDLIDQWKLVLDRVLHRHDVHGFGPEQVERGLAIVTGLVPTIGYDRSAAIAKEAAATGRTVREVCREKTDLDEAQLDAALDPFRMTVPES